MIELRPSLRERLASAAGAAGVVGLLGYLLIVGGHVDMRLGKQPVTTLLDLAPSVPVPIKPPVVAPRANRARHQAAPPNLRNKATDIVAPPPLIVLPPPLPMVAAAKPNIGAAASSGASDHAGPGTGAGGRGDGAGGGGDDDDGDGDLPPRLIKGRLKFSDLSQNLRESGTGGTVSVRYDVNVDGRVSGCVITASSGSGELDRQTCQLIETRFRYRPSRNPAGQPVRSIIEEDHSWVVERTPDAAPAQR